jgi:hypothetical protein
LALLYLKQCNYDLEGAIDVYKEEEKWEKENPLDKVLKGNTGVSQGLGTRVFRFFGISDV